MDKNTFTREEVEKLLKQQRELCHKEAKIDYDEYVNPYSEADGNITRYVTKESIMNAKLKF